MAMSFVSHHQYTVYIARISLISVIVEGASVKTEIPKDLHGKDRVRIH